MKQIISKLVIGVFLVSTSPAFAEHGERRHEGREMGRFNDHEMRSWQAGRWHHGRHQGRSGWWWIAGGVWYYYPAPVYPFPDPYTPPVTVINQSPAVVVQQPAPPVRLQAQTAPPAQFWHYCDSARDYFPSVQSCPEGWVSVPTQPLQADPR